MDSPAGAGNGGALLLEYRLLSRIEEIPKLADAVSAALPDRSDLAFAANLCLEELITNTIKYGLQGRADHQIQVRMTRSDEWLEITIRDDAPRFDPFVAVPEPDLELGVVERPIGGLGIHLVRRMMDRAHAEWDGAGNVIVLAKRVSGGTANA